MTFEYDWPLDIVIDPKTMQVTAMCSLLEYFELLLCKTTYTDCQHSLEV